MLWVRAFVFLAQESVLDTRNRKGQTGIIPGFRSIKWVWFLNLLMLPTCTGSWNSKFLVPESPTQPIPEETLCPPICFMLFSYWHLEYLEFFSYSNQPLFCIQLNKPLCSFVDLYSIVLSAFFPSKGESFRVFWHSLQRVWPVLCCCTEPCNQEFWFRTMQPCPGILGAPEVSV